VFDDKDSVVADPDDAPEAEPEPVSAPDPVDEYKVRALRDQEELKALKALLAESGQRPNDEIEFFRKQLADIETVHSKCFDVRRQLGAAELQLSKVQSELKEKSDDVIRLKCDDAGLRVQVAESNNTAALLAVELQAQKEENNRLRLQMDDASRHSAVHARQGWEEAERRQQQVVELERHVATLQRQVEEASGKPVPASPNAALLLQLERTAERASQLEDQNRSAQKGMDDLFRQLSDMSRQKVALEDQARSDQQTIAALRRQLDQYQNQPSAAPVVSAADKKRLVDLAEVNSTLLALTKESQFQQDLERPLVKVALTAWSGANVSHISESQLESARFDEGVARIYPRLKAFELVCDAARIRFPVDHIQQHRTELSTQAVVEAFGPEFVALHLISQK
jgi:chromosome segregation ATPase